MPRPPLAIQIPQPCAEAWAAMTPRGAGRHCASCQQVVIDFTQKTDAEILAIVGAAAGGHACGRFRASQLSRPLRQPLPARRRGWSTAVAATVALLLGRSLAGSEARAQSSHARHPRLSQHSPEPEAWRTPAPAAEAATAAPDTVRRNQVSGRVVDEQSGEGLPGVTVLIQGTTHGISTDSRGNFVLPLEPQEQQAQLEFHSIGYRAQVIPMPADGQRIVLKVDDRMLAGEVVVTGGFDSYPIYTPRGVWSRVCSIPYRVRNLFR